MQMLSQKMSCSQTIKGSRFLAFAYPVSSHEAAKDLLTVIKKDHSKANHHCFAWRLSGGEERVSDDGEPRGSAGPPILKRLISLNCVQTMVVVVRYFGGTKLGIGGLIRAYGGVTQELLTQSIFVPFIHKVYIDFSYAYSDSNIVSQVLFAIDNAIENQCFTDIVTVRVLVRKEMSERFVQCMFSESSGRIQCTIVE